MFQKHFVAILILIKLTAAEFTYNDLPVDKGGEFLFAKSLNSLAQILLF